LRDWLAERGCQAVIPPQANRKHPHSYDPGAYRQRNVVERFFCRLKDFRRIHTRYDKRADIFLSALLIVAASHLVGQLRPDPSQGETESNDRTWDLSAIRDCAANGSLRQKQAFRVSQSPPPNEQENAVR
jgi:hypothetical protein